MQTIVKVHIWEGTKSERQLTIKRPSTPSSPKTDQKHLSESVETAQTNPRSGPARLPCWAGEGHLEASQKTFARGNFEHCCGIQKNRKQTFTYVSYVLYLQTAGTQTSKSCLCFPGSHSWHWPVQRTVDWPQRIAQKHNQHTADQLKTAWNCPAPLSFRHFQCVWPPCERVAIVLSSRLTNSQNAWIQ